MLWGGSAWGTSPWGAPSGASVVSIAISDSVGATSPLLVTLTAMLHDQANAVTPLSSMAAYHLAISEAANARTVLRVVWNNLLTSSANATTTLGFTASVIQNIVDTLLATGEVASVQEAKNAIVEAVFALDKLNRDAPESVTDAISLADSMQSTLVTLMLLVDEAAAAITLGSQVNVTAIVADGVDVMDLAQHILAAQESMADGVVCALSFEIDGDSFSGVVINTESSAVTEYTNWPFNSFARLGGNYLGCSADGVYLLEGSDDNGTAIESYIRTGLIQIGKGKKARVPEAFLGLTTSGDLVMKTITTHPDGTKEENWYKLEKRPATANRSTRVKIGRGLESVYWAFELHSVSGSTFGLDTLRLYPMILDRLI